MLYITDTWPSTGRKIGWPHEQAIGVVVYYTVNTISGVQNCRTGYLKKGEFVIQMPIKLSKIIIFNLYFRPSDIGIIQI